jgi:sugar-specific transcriptional regulator TrmB
MTIESDLVKHLDLVNKVASEYLKGSDATEISKSLDIPRPRVMTLLNDWRAMASNNQAIHARAKEALAGADQHFSSLIKKTYEVIDAADQTANLTAKTTSIKLIADIETKRLEMLQKAGLLDNKEIAEQIIEMERKHDILIKILKDIASGHPEIREEIMKRLSEIQTEVIVIDND